MSLPSSEGSQETSRPAAPAVVENDRLATIRPCEPADLTRVAELFEKTFRGKRRCDAAALATYLGTLLFEHPWRDPEIASLVSSTRSGALRGFIGILPAHMRLGDRPVRAALAGSLMVDEPEKHPLAGASLFRAFIKGPQELSFSETSNAISLRLWDALGGSTAPLFSLEWIKPLRPAAAAYAFLREKVSAAALLRPLVGAAEHVVRAMTKLPDPHAGDVAIVNVAFDDAPLLDLIIKLTANFRLAPRWETDDLRWMLSLAGEKERYGPLICKIVRGKQGKEIGCFLYYARPGGIAFVLQVFSERAHRARVVDALFADAYAFSCVALRGRLQPELLGVLQVRDCVFVNRSSLTYKTRDREILAAVHDADGLLTGLSGESWTRLIGGFA